MLLSLSVLLSADCDLPLLRSTIDSITQTEESKIAYDYVVILRNNKFEHMDMYYFKEIGYLKHTTREKIWKQQQTEKTLW